MIWLLENHLFELAGQNEQDMVKFLQIVVAIYRSKYADDEVNKRIEVLINEASKEDGMQKIMKAMHEEMGDEDKKKLEMCVASGI